MKKISFPCCLIFLILNNFALCQDWEKAKKNYPNEYEMLLASHKAGFTYSGVNEEGYLDYRHDQTGIVMVLIPSGSFTMGSSYAEKDRNMDEIPIHDVYLDPYLIGKYEVTQAQWENVMGNNPSYFKNPSNPVENISWEDAQGFCAKTGFRLPTEAQWEKSCRAGKSTRFYWGGDEDYNDISDYAWYVGNSESKTHLVGKKKPNGFGLYDMNGNVWEYCLDRYHFSYYRESPQKNPSGPSTGSSYVMRGGAWNSDPSSCRSANRNRCSIKSCNIVQGFRVVMNIKK